MDEPTKRVWDVWLGFIAPILTVVGILIGVWQFNSGEQNKARLEHELVTQKDNLDFHRKLWLEQVGTYRSIAELAGKIVAHANDGKLEDFTKDFVAAYWGTMVLVEDHNVEKATIDFSVAIADFKEGWIDEKTLKDRADVLIKACRHSEESPP
ncbi:MAG: hypothetical protein WB586_21900 [Chthoniobacterales bacterium]